MNAMMAERPCNMNCGLCDNRDTAKMLFCEFTPEPGLATEEVMIAATQGTRLQAGKTLIEKAPAAITNNPGPGSIRRPAILWKSRFSLVEGKSARPCDESKTRRGSPERRSGLLDAARRDQAAVLSDLENVAKHYEVELKTAIRTGIAPEVAILHEVRSRKVTLVVMGVSRRSAEILPFGTVADAVLEGWTGR